MSEAPTGRPQGWNPKIPAALPAKNVSGKVNLRPEDFDKLVDLQGVRVKVFRTSFCPNVKSIDGAEHEIDCELCHGSQFIDKYCLESWAFIQNQALEKQHNPEGLYDGNSVAATFKQGVELQYFTLVELLDHSEQFYERVKRQQGKTDVLRYPGLRVNLLVDSKGKEYVEGSDFIVDANGNITWCDDRGPIRGRIYTINYETKIRFRAIKAMHSNRFAQIARAGQTIMVKMNEQWVLQKEYLVVRKDAAGKVLKKNKIRDSDEDDSAE